MLRGRWGERGDERGDERVSLGAPGEGGGRGRTDDGVRDQIVAEPDDELEAHGRDEVAVHRTLLADERVERREKKSAECEAKPESCAQWRSTSTKPALLDEVGEKGRRTGGDVAGTGPCVAIFEQEGHDPAARARTHQLQRRRARRTTAAGNLPAHRDLGADAAGGSESGKAAREQGEARAGTH